MTDRAVKRTRAKYASIKGSKRRSSGEGHQDLSMFEPTETSHCPKIKLNSEFEPLQSQNVSIQHDPATGLPPGKMLLPPLPRSRAEYMTTPRTEKNRTSHACDKCRKAKAKCSGGQPCEKCITEDKECVYGDSKRDKERKEMERLQYRNQEIEQKNDRLVKALLSFASELGPNKRQELEKLVMSPILEANDDNEDMTTHRESDRIVSYPEDDIMSGEYTTDADVGTPCSLDIINEDANRDEHSRAVGFLGKSSSVTWVHGAKKAATHDLEDRQRVHRSTGPAANSSFADSAYHAEIEDILTISAEDVDALAWPPSKLARVLVDSYFDRVHVSFPVLSRNDFYKEFETFPKDQISPEDRCWLSIANMVFAIGAKFAQLTNADFRGNDRDHCVYYARACALGMDYRTLNLDPELQQTSCLGLLGLYLLASDQLNKSWIVCGIAVRHATALGLHVRSEAKDLSDMDKELRVRLWWSLYYLERLLDELTGRPSCISDRNMSTPLPINMEESRFRRDYAIYQKQSTQSVTSPTIKGKVRFSGARMPTPATSSSASVDPSTRSTLPTRYPAYEFSMTRLPISSSTYFIYQTQLSIISHEILTELYCATVVKAKWSEVQDTIRDIDSRLLKWKSNLPEEFDFSNPPSKTDSFTPYRTGLSMFYNSSRMTLFRPCLCRLEGRIVNESERSKIFDSNAAATCVESARNVLASIPSMSDPSRVYAVTSWWNVVHYIVIACSFLMLELAYGAEHFPSQAKEILADSKKAILLLHSMSNKSIVARKSWEIFDSLLQIVAPKVGGETLSMPRTAPVPPGWRWNRFGTHPKRDNFQEQYRQTTGQASQPYSAYSNRMHDWASQSDHDIQQSYSAPVVEGSHNPFIAISSTIPGYLSGLYPFSEIYGPYNEFDSLQTQNMHLPHGAAETMYRSTASYPSAEGRSTSMTNHPVLIPPSWLTQGQVQLGGEIGGSEELGYGDIGTTEEPMQDFEMEGYRSWNEAPS